MPDLVSAFSRLNDDQREAVRHDDNTVVLAGPGSGKTATLVVKVAHLLTTLVPPTRGVACITFNNDAVDEFRSRLAHLGFAAGRRLYLGSVHSFCLNCIVRPYGPLVDPPISQNVRVASARAADRLLERIATEKIPNLYMPSYGSLITRLRRAQACGEDISGFADADLVVVKEYERALAEGGFVDFEAMVLCAVKLVSEHRWIRRLLAARFPWLIVDEYQDLGGPLHHIVTALADQAGIKVFAVGDPDQTVYDFTGANPRYLAELAARDDFKPIRLKFNYRSGGDLIAASQAALAPEDGPRPYQPDPERTDRGEVIFRQATDDLLDHAHKAVTAVREQIGKGVSAHEIAVLYRSKTELFPELKAVFDDSGIAYVAERERRYPGSPLSRWLQQAAGWAVAAPPERETPFGEILRFYAGLLTEAGLADSRGADLRQRAAFYRFLRGTSPDTPLYAWLTAADKDLELTRALQASSARPNDDLEVFRELLKESNEGRFRSHRVRDFAEDGRARGKVVLTTLHSCKGRQFDVVVLPGLVEGVIPSWRWNRRARELEPPQGAALREARRLFYVGFTRARHVVYLIYSKAYTNKNGYTNRLGPSRFVVEIYKRLKEAATDSA